MITENDVKLFINQHHYDIRISKNGRWIDQKCTMDVVSAIADFIYNYYINTQKNEFSSRDIWYSSYAKENVENVFKKPNPKNDKSKNEYDKFFQQPMEMLANAGVLQKSKKGNMNIYKIQRIDILEYIALREKNALNFIKLYVEKVIEDSGIKNIFDDFFEKQDSISFSKLKFEFYQFIITHTKINGKTECNRIFTKVLNPLAYFKNLKGTERGYISKHIITLDMLVYNRLNFRDILSNKPKNITRKEHEPNKDEQNREEAYRQYQMKKAINFLKLFNAQYRNSKTEHLDGIHEQDTATQMHHIFPQAAYPEIAALIENLIALTPTQHLSYAHPENNTHEIDEQYQYLLLLSKSARIEENLLGKVGNEPIYNFNDFITVLQVGFKDNSVCEIENMNFKQVMNAINLHYNSIK